MALPLDSTDLAAIWLTIELASLTTLLLLLIGTPIAWWLARTRSWLKGPIGAVVALPLVLPPTVIGFYLLVSMGPNGFIGQLTQSLGLGTLPFTFAGLVVGSVFYSLPFVVQPLQNAFEAIGEKPLEAAATLRASPVDRFFSVVLPLARPGFVTAAILGFAHTVGEFGVASCGVLLASVVGVIFGPTGLVISSFSLFIEPIAADLDWDRGQSALPVTLLGLAVALSSPLKGWLVDRWGARALVLPLTAALALCLASLALARSGWQLYLLFALLGLLTPGNIPYARILGGWFERRRGAAYGILGLGFGVGGPLALYLGSACIDAFGWRATFLVYGLLEGLLALPLLYALFRERPGDLPQARRMPADALPGATPGQAWRSADFWLIVGNLILGVFAVTGVMVHGVPLLQERGLSREVATDVLAALWVGMIVSQPALGYLLDRYDTPRIALPFALLAALGLLLLLLGGPPALLWGAVFLIGLGAGGETGTTQYFVSRYFGLRHFSVIYGSIQPFTFAIAISLGSWLLGYFYDRAGSYAGSTLVLLGAFGVAAGLLVMLGRYRYAIDGEACSHGRD
ncbi:TPA: MFS transporter [Pseudomonas aeruginosa]|nr:MFS transporter [Pseudomonas aeruginosa]